MQRVPLGLQEYVREDTNSIGSVTEVITCRSTISCRVFSICLQYSVGTFLCTC